MSLSEQQESKLVQKILRARQNAIDNQNIGEGLTPDEVGQIKNFLNINPPAITQTGKKIQDEALEYIQRKGAQAGLSSLQNNQEAIAEILLELKKLKKGGKRRSTKRKKTNIRRRSYKRNWFIFKTL
jgi:uncharacterized protein with von Willebrand factor type A (vWA) domain